MDIVILLIGILTLTSLGYVIYKFNSKDTDVDDPQKRQDDIDQMKEILTLQFKNLANEIIDEKTKKINERHRHRYEVNINYKEKLEQIGLNFAGISPDGLLPEIVEIKNHPWFVGVQFHPELKSRPFDPHPLFSSFIKASIKESINKKIK